MGPARPDPFEQFVGKHGLKITTQDVAAYPRDVLAPPGELDRHVLVTLLGSRGDAQPVLSLFVASATDPRPASTRDVMWWLSADSWAYERAQGDLQRWAGLYGYPDEPETLRLMRLHARQAEALVALLGRETYDELLAVYERELNQRS